MKKLSKIDESLWGDIRDRVNDDSVRQEDDLSKDEKDILVNCISWFAVRVVYNQDYQPDLHDLSYYVKDFLLKGSDDYDIDKILKCLKVNWNNTYKQILDDRLKKEEDEKRNEGKTNESLWGNIRDRVNGETERKEDDINTLDGRDMVKYIIQNYRINDNNEQPRYSGFNVLNVYLYMFKESENMYSFNCIFYDYDDNIIYISNSMHNSTYKRICSNPDYITEVYDKDYTSIKPKNGSVCNRFLIQVIDFILDGLDKECTPVLAKKEVNESLWGGIRDRVNGDTVRKEDDINILDIKGLFQYFVKNYKLKPTVKDENIHLSNSSDTYIYIPFEGSVNFPNCLRAYSDKTNDQISYIMVEDWKIFEKNDIKKLQELLGGDYTIFHEENKFFGTIIRRDGCSMVNKEFIDVFDKIMEVVKKPIIYKIGEIEESLWGSIRDRVNGDDIRKEDEVGNIKELVPVDMGVSVLWADRDLERKDGDCYFDYNEASNIIKNSKWRIPTKQESYELFQYTTMIKNTDEVCILEGDFDDKPQLIFDKKGYQYGDNDKIFQKSMYTMWTCTEAKEIEAYYMSVIARMNDNHYTPMHYGNRLCVRLVQDRK